MKTWLAWFGVSLVAAAGAWAADVNRPPEYETFLIVPLRIHVLTSKELPQADCTITDHELARAVAEIQRIWDRAGIHFGVESIIHEPPAQVGRFRAMAVAEIGQPQNHGYYSLLFPPGSRVFDGLHVYYFRELSGMNSIYLAGADATLAVQEPQLRPVGGGSEVPAGRVAARGLGCALGLSLRPDDLGLLSASTTGCGLDEREVERARRVALTVPGALTVPAARDAAVAAEAKGKIPEARRLWTWLSEVPGPPAAEARKRLASLVNDRP
jgi:hypothetical protein